MKKTIFKDDDNQNSLRRNESLLAKPELEQLVRQTAPSKLNTAPAVFWDPEDSLKNGAIDDSNVKQQLNIVENGVLYSAKLYNDLKVKNECLVKKLKRSISTLEEQRCNFEGLDAMKNAETDEGIRIAALKKDVEAIEDDIKLHAHYSRQLDHMQLRLKTNQLKFDTHMTAMEQSMPSILKEQEEVAHLRRCLGVAMGKASLVLEETKAGLNLAQKDRECLMRKRLDEMRNAESLREWMKRRKEAKRLLALELRGDLSKEEERFLKDQMSAKVTELKKLQKESEDSTRKLQELEAFLAKLKLATGVVDLSDIAEKFATQRVSRVYLDEEVRMAERRLATLKEAFHDQQLGFCDSRSTETDQADISHIVTAQLKVDMECARTELRAGTAQAERRASTLLDLQQGTNGILQRLLPYSAEVAAELDALDIRHNIAVTEDDRNNHDRSTVDALSHIDILLTKMVEIIETESCNSEYDGEDDYDTKSMANSTRNFDAIGTGDELDTAEPQSLLALTASVDSFNVMSDPNVLNVRVKSRQMQHDDETELIRSLATPPSKERSRERSSRLKTGDRSGRVLESLIPSRELVKQKSERMLREETQRRARAMKKSALLQQQSTRRKSLALALQAAATQSQKVPGSAGAGEDDDDAKLAADREYKMIAQGLAVKEQRDYCAKLSHSHSANQDLSLRADVVAKVQSFFERKPQLD